MMTPEALMQAAISKAREGILAGQTPFGCAISARGGLLAAAHNTVLATPDATAHAEINAIRASCELLGRHLLEGAVVATTCEPCPMCMAALHWARVAEVHFGADIADADAAGFNELSVSAADLLRLGKSSVRVTGGLLAGECRELFREWRSSLRPTAY